MSLHWGGQGPCIQEAGAIIRDWSLITGRGGLHNGRGGGHVKFYPYGKGGGRKKF